jgi:hypothetical protein
MIITYEAVVQALAAMDRVQPGNEFCLPFVSRGSARTELQLVMRFTCADPPTNGRQNRLEVCTLFIAAYACTTSPYTVTPLYRTVGRPGYGYPPAYDAPAEWMYMDPDGPSEPEVRLKGILDHRQVSKTILDAKGSCTVADM